MNTFAKLTSGAALAAALVLPLATPVAAGEKSQDLVVRPSSAMDAWKAEANRDLDRTLQTQPHSGKFQIASGIVQITFTLGEDGRADNIKLHNSTSNFWGERLAKRAVRKLDNLDEVPVRNPAKARFIANLIFADGYASKEKLMAELDRTEATRLASAKPESQYIALGM